MDDLGVPSGQQPQRTGKSQSLSSVNQRTKWAMFNSYFKLPEGISTWMIWGYYPLFRKPPYKKHTHTRQL